MEIETLIDDRNRELFRTVGEHFNIQLVESDDDGWSESTHELDARISFAPSAYPIACFTHELLHLKKKIEGYRAPLRVLETNSQAEYDKLEPTVDGLIGYAYNQLMHEKMFPEFVNLGFPANEFLADSDCRTVPMSLKKDIRKLKAQFKGEIPCGVLIYPFLAANSPHDKSQQAKQIQRNLRKLSKDSYAALSKFLRNWRNEDDPTSLPYHFAKMFKLCQLENVGFGYDENHLTWAREITM